MAYPPVLVIVEEVLRRLADPLVPRNPGEYFWAKYMVRELSDRGLGYCV